MLPRNFEYFAPRSLWESLNFLAEAGGETRILAGGQSLIPALKMRNAAVKHILDISGLHELKYVRREEDKLRIGALTTTAAVENGRELQDVLPVLPEAAATIADPLVRNLGTVGGDLCYADPANDFPAVMTALNASFTIFNKQGSRIVPADDFFIEAFKTALKRDEILTEIEIPLGKGPSGSAYQKIKKRSGGFTIAGAAVCLSLGGGGAIDYCRIAMTAAGPKPMRAAEAEKAFLGQKADSVILGKISRLAAAQSQPAGDLTASAEYRRKSLAFLVHDALDTACRRAMKA